MDRICLVAYQAAVRALEIDMRRPKYRLHEPEKESDADQKDDDR
jgi:hypothetical protein